MFEYGVILNTFENEIRPIDRIRGIKLIKKSAKLGIFFFKIIIIITLF
jgi:hypothetical protein